MIVLNKEALEAFGTSLRGKFTIYDSERGQLEQQWLKNLRQYKAIYDPDIKIPEGRSRVYPKDTHTKIVGWVAKMLEMMFPAQEKNWELQVTPFPNIGIKDLEGIIQGLEQAALQASQDPAAQGQPPIPVTSDDIEKAVKAFAEARKVQMELECEDQLDDKTDYPELCKKVLRRGGIYGFGVAEGPLVYQQKEREWEQDPTTGQYRAVDKSVHRPYYEPLKAWDVYPDLSAKCWDDQEGLFVRKVMPRHGLVALAKRDDFFGDVIIEFLREHTTSGNYKARSFEAELNEVKHVQQNPPNMNRQFEVIRWYGYVAAQDLKDIGVTVPDSALGKDILADVWLLDSTVIKADTAPFGEKVSDMFHAFIPEEDEDGPLTGNSRVEILRDSQMKLCAIDRKTMDNMAKGGSIVETNDDLLSPESKTGGAISGGDTIHRQGDGNDANYPAIRTYDIPSNIGELLELRQAVLQVFDVESNLPSWRMGNAQPLGEAFRTSNNMSMMAGGGDMVTKDDVRAFDKFVKSLIGSLVKWNMEFNPKTEIKGDFSVLPKGNLSLVAKEVRGAALDQLAQSLSPRELAIIDERRLLIDRLKSRDLSTDYVLPEDESKQVLAQMDQAQSQAAQVEQSVSQTKAQQQQAAADLNTAKAQEIQNLIPAKVEETTSKTASNYAKAKGVKDGSAIQSAKLLLDATKPETKGAGIRKAPKGKAAGK